MTSLILIRAQQPLASPSPSQRLEAGGSCRAEKSLKSAKVGTHLALTIKIVLDGLTLYTNSPSIMLFLQGLSDLNRCIFWD